MRCTRTISPFSCASAAKCRTARCSQASAVGRRDALAGVSLAAAALVATPPAQAAKKNPNFNTLRDTGDGYELVYPFGWQEVQVQGIDVVYKDIIEPLESCAVQLVPTTKTNITEYGTPNEIAGTLARTVLSADNDEVQLIKSEAEKADNRDYVTFEFLQKAQRFKRHVLAAATVANGKLMLFTIGASEKRWPKLKDRLLTSVQSFKGFERFS